mgnify:CR=1 FL=1
MNFYGLSEISLLADIDSKVVAGSLGHNTYTITFDRYQHVMTSMKEAHATAIDNILEKEPQEA